jgi:hypothetical protein
MKKPSEKQILNRSYELWQEAGMPEGREDEFWLQAETELSQATTPDERSETLLE